MNTLPSPLLIAGSSGLVGSALVASWRRRGCEVRRLVRGKPEKTGEFEWNPAARQIDEAALAGVAAVVNLAGANLADGRWTKRRRELIRASRVDSTRCLVDALARHGSRPEVFVNASATGWYGDTGGKVADETAARGQGFLAEVCAAWEEEAGRAVSLGVRTVCLRLGVVLSAQGGALAKMLPVFKLGLGGRLGSGAQRMSWIAMPDLIAVVERVLGDGGLSGPINAVAPAPATNAAFARALGAALGRPAFLPAPEWALRLVLGQMADEALLADSCVVPAKLQAAGFSFRCPDIRTALQVTLHEGA